MNILGIDYGTKRIGLAWVQTDLDVVVPFGLVQCAGAAKQVVELLDVIEKEEIDQLVVGLPFGLDGGENDNTKRIRAFVDTLQEKKTIPVEFVDERFTTAQANRDLGDVSADERAAMILLETYLDQKK